MIRTQKLLFVVTLVALQFSGLNSFATSSQCISSFVQTAPAAVGIPADLSIFKAATPLKNGGIAPGSKILNQKCSSICWAYGLNELVDQMLLTNTGVAIETSPDHNGFWHFYFQIQNHASYFTRLANRIQSGQISLEDATREAINLMKDTEYGLTASIYSANYKRAETVMEQMNSGSVYWNCCDRVSATLPWSGRQHSGIGSTLSYQGIRAFVHPKAYHIRG